MEYKQTLNLPKTDLPIRANLQVVEEECLKKWGEEETYRKLEDKNKDKGHAKYILHDGPPYPNGDIHLGHALNKVLKDIIIKYKLMQGFHAPFVPGWDCHGLPIETQLIKKLGDKRKELGTLEFRKLCREYALNYVELQKKEFVRLGCFGEWDNPYLTLNRDYEEKIAEVFGTLSEKGYIYRGLKPIHWCPSCETALAEAELEYEDDKSPSIYVKFPMSNVKCQMFIIWTTTPWTLPANVAVAVHPDFEYVFLKTKDEVYVVAEGLVKDFTNRMEITDFKIIEKTRGKNLEGTILKHPFLEREVPVILGEIVTLEQGTGCVHIAPGHGQEDYLLGLKYKLPIIMPVNERGILNDTTGPGAGLHYSKANPAITEYMKENGSLLHLDFFKHSYPHCWRCKKPVIFRATEQWFVAVDHNDLRKKSLQAIKETKWYPSWGENRITGMVSGRPDWCISRQRSWGVPIPAFYCENCGEVHTTGEFNKAAKELFKKEGSDAWFKYDASDILPKGTKCKKCNGINFKKETDILDVWFESGSSHAAVIADGIADLYLEGSDQHRGWFQTSLLTAVGTKGHAPFKAVLTHGFTIDESGKKMSKSLGNVVNPQEVVKKYGADVLRLWVASTDFRNDMAASDNILKQVQDAYLKIRNTCRFLISNLYDFDKPVEYGNLLEIDKWILLRLNKLIEKVTGAYDGFEFHLVYHSVYEFCVKDLSSLYLDILKDRLYCEKADSSKRRSGQTALSEILKTLIGMLAPILSFTSEDVNKYLRLTENSFFESGFPRANPKYLDGKLEEKWEKVFCTREKVYKKIEELRDKKEIKSSSQAAVTVWAKEEELEALKSLKDELSTIFMVSEVSLEEGDKEPEVVPSTNPKCERCWRLLPTTSGLCQRCTSAIS